MPPSAILSQDVRQVKRRNCSDLQSEIRDTTMASTAWPKYAEGYRHPELAEGSLLFAV